MKLARVKVEYTCGLVLMDGASLDLASGRFSIPPRLTRLMTMMQETECSPAFSLDTGLRLVPRGMLCLPRWTAPMLFGADKDSAATGSCTSAASIGAGKHGFVWDLQPSSKRSMQQGYA